VRVTTGTHAARRSTLHTAAAKAARGPARRRFIVSLCLAALNRSLTAHAETLRPEDPSARDPGAITVDHRTLPGSTVPELRVRTVIAVPARRVHAVIADYNAFADFMPYVTRSRILDASDGIFRVYQRLRLPWPLTERRYVIRAIHRHDGPRPGVYRASWRLDARATPRLAEQPGIPPRTFSGSWELRPTRNGRSTGAVYTVHMDPGGEVPKWLVSFVTDHFVPQIIAAVRGRASASRTTATGRDADPATAVN